MNHLLLVALTTCLAATAQAQPPVTPTTIASTVSQRLKTTILPLHKELSAHLREQRKQADDRERIEAAQAKKVAQEKCVSEKRSIQSDYLAEKKSRKAVFSQLQATLKKAKRAAFTRKAPLSEKLARVGSYLDVLAEQAETAQFKALHKKVNAEHKWLRSVQSSLNK